MSNLSESDFEKNLVTYLTFFLKQYIEKQEQVRIELVNKQRYLYDFAQIQEMSREELWEQFRKIEQVVETLNKRYQQVNTEYCVLSLSESYYN